MIVLILCTAVLSRLFGQEDPCGIVVCTPGRIVSLVRPSPAAWMSAPSVTSAGTGGLESGGAPAGSPHVGSWAASPAVGPSRGARPPGALSDPSFSPHTHYSGHSAGDYVETLWTWRASIRLTARGVFTAWQRSCPRACACAASAPLSPSAPQPPHLTSCEGTSWALSSGRQSAAQAHLPSRHSR